MKGVDLVMETPETFPVDHVQMIDWRSYIVFANGKRYKARLMDIVGSVFYLLIKPLNPDNTEVYPGFQYKYDSKKYKIFDELMEKQGYTLKEVKHCYDQEMLVENKRKSDARVLADIFKCNVLDGFSILGKPEINLDLALAIKYMKKHPESYQRKIDMDASPVF